MSGRLVSAVLASALEAWLKPYAMAYASFGEDDGSKVYPGIRRIARELGKSERQAQNAAAALRSLRVLKLQQPAGPHRSARYVFDITALPQPGDGRQIPLFSGAKRAHPQRDRKKR
jgi:hypothetical protein